MIGETLLIPAESETTQGQWLPATMMELDIRDTPRLTFRVVMTLANGNTRHGISTAFVTDARLLQHLQNEVRPGDKIEVCIRTDWEAEDIPTTLLDLSYAIAKNSFVRKEGNAAFFSFGSNDLTQMSFGFSRDDAGKFLVPYIEQKILPTDPFDTIDQAGVGKLMQMAVKSAQTVRPDIKLGICGEHGGEPESVKFCHKIGLNYVSCSPFRVPIARLAAAQAAINDGKERDK